MREQHTRILAVGLGFAICVSFCSPAFARGGGGRGGGGGGRGGGGFGGGGGRSFGGGGGRSFGGGGGRSFGGGGGRSFGGGGGRSFGGGGGRSFGGGGGRSFGGGGRGEVSNRMRDHRSDFGGGGGFGGSLGGNDGLAGMAGNGGRVNRPTQLPSNGRDFGGRGNYGGRNPNFGGRLPNSGGGLSGIAGNRPARPTRPINKGEWTNQANNIRNNFAQKNTVINGGSGRWNNIDHPGAAVGIARNWDGGNWNNWNNHPYWNNGAWLGAGSAALGGLLGITIGALAGGGDSGGDNIVYEGDNVYVDGQPAGTAEQYYDQAQQLALRPVADWSENDQAQDQWQPLGVFAIASPGQAEANMIVQLSINQAGVIGGQYVNQITGENAEVHGTLDKQTQRVSFTIGAGRSTIFDTTLKKLTQDQADVLVHYGKDTTQQMLLVRLPQPEPAPSDITLAAPQDDD